MSDNNNIPDWEEASPEVIHIAERLIEQHHYHLKPINLCFVFRKEAQKNKGRMVLGQVAKVPERFRPFMDVEYDYMIWLSREDFERMTTAERTALIDHELCHIQLRDGAYTLVGHDFEEFYQIIQRYGFWDERLQRIDRELMEHQLRLGAEVDKFFTGKVGTITTEQAAKMENTNNG